MRRRPKSPYFSKARSIDPARPLAPKCHSKAQSTVSSVSSVEYFDSVIAQRGTVAFPQVTRFRTPQVTHPNLHSLLQEMKNKEHSAPRSAKNSVSMLDAYFAGGAGVDRRTDWVGPVRVWAVRERTVARRKKLSPSPVSTPSKESILRGKFLLSESRANGMLANLEAEIHRMTANRRETRRL